MKTLPGVREVIEARRRGEADHYAIVTTSVLDHYRAQLDRLMKRLNE